MDLIFKLNYVHAYTYCLLIMSLNFLDPSKYCHHQERARFWIRQRKQQLQRKSSNMQWQWNYTYDGMFIFVLNIGKFEIPVTITYMYVSATDIKYILIIHAGCGIMLYIAITWSIDQCVKLNICFSCYFRLIVSLRKLLSIQMA